MLEHVVEALRAGRVIAYPTDTFYGLGVDPTSEAAVERMDVVGPICETGDRFAEQRPMPPVESGELVVFCTAGAYGAVMASTYNTRPAAPEVMVNGKDFAVVRPRLSYDTLIGQDVVPAWL